MSRTSDPMDRGLTLADLRSAGLLRKMTSPAESRMRNRTAKQQLADALNALRGPDEIPPPDADDSSVHKRFN